MTDSPRPDIESRDDVDRIVSAFYHNIACDPLLGPYFDGVDLATHVPRLVDFWASVVFQSGTYRGQPFAPHARMDGLTARHFRRWLDRFEATVDGRFAGARADRMKQRARQVATIFQSKLGVLDPADVADRFESPAS